MNSCCGNDQEKEKKKKTETQKEKSECCSDDKQSAANEKQNSEKNQNSCCGGNKHADDKADENKKVTDHLVSSCCSSAQPLKTADETILEGGCCGGTAKVGKKRIDLIFWIPLIIIALGYIAQITVLKQPVDDTSPSQLYIFTNTIYRFMNDMAIGIIVGILFAGLLDYVPKEAFARFLGHDKGAQGILRATVAGVVLDMCNHGILMVAAKLYNKGVKSSQVMAFLVASPWNSLSLTVILWSLIGLQWTLIFTVASMVIAFFTGLIFEELLKKGQLPPNPNSVEIIEGDNTNMKELFKKEFQKIRSESNCSSCIITDFLIRSLKGSVMILRWLFLGVVLAAIIATFVPTDVFTQYFGRTLMGLGLTLIAATIIEVCSEGSVPIATQLFNVARAPGNAFTFLMTGAATDYTEIMILRDTTKSWKTTLFLPLVTVPQILLLGYIMNQFGG